MCMKDGKTARIQIVLSDKEKELFVRAARKESLSLSAWIRYVAVKAARKVVGTKDGTEPTV